MAGIPIRTLQGMQEVGDSQATQLLDRLDARYDTYVAERKAIEHAMAHAAHDGRPTQTRMAAQAAVNGQEVRGAERWTSTPLDAVTDADGRTIDPTCYRLVPPASGIGPVQRVPFVAPDAPSTSDASPRKATSTAPDAGEAYWNLVRAVGVDRSLATDDN